MEWRSCVARTPRSGLNCWRSARCLVVVTLQDSNDSGRSHLKIKSYCPLRPPRMMAAGFQRTSKETHSMATTSRSNFKATLKTVVLLAALGGILVGAGYLIGGPQVALLFLIFSVLINMGSWFFSDKLALRMSRAQPVSEEEDPRLYQMVRDLTTRAGLPMPKLYVIPQEQPNAFATGRNPDHSAVAVTAGIRKLLTEDELRGVLAHEL